MIDGSSPWIDGRPVTRQRKFIENGLSLTLSLSLSRLFVLRRIDTQQLRGEGGGILKLSDYQEEGWPTGQRLFKLSMNRIEWWAD